MDTPTARSRSVRIELAVPRRRAPGRDPLPTGGAIRRTRVDQAVAVDRVPPAGTLAWLLLSTRHTLTKRRDTSMRADRRSMLIAVAMAATLATACEKPAAGAQAATAGGVRHRGRATRRARVPRPRRADTGLSGRRYSRPRRRLSRLRQLHGGVVRPQGRPAVSNRPEATRGDPGRRRTPNWRPRPRRGSTRPTTTSPATRRSSPSRR